MKKLLSVLLVVMLVCSMAVCYGADEVTYTELYSSELKTLDTVDSTLTALTTFSMTCQIGLIYFDNYGLLRPAIAKNWSVSEDGTVYTFYLRDDIDWVNYKGKVVGKVTANDFVTACRHILEDQTDVANTIYNNIVGAKEYYEGTTTDYSTVGIQALDDYTLQYTLKGPLVYFLRMLGNPVWYPIPTDFFAENKETFGTTNEDLLYNGAYYCSSYEYEYERVLKKNDNFFNADKISIDTVIYRYNKEATSNGPELFARGDTDRISSVNNAIAKEFLADETRKDLIRTNEYNNMSYWLMFNYDPQFAAEYEPDNWRLAVNNVNFRKSFFYGFDAYSYNAVLDEFHYKANTQTAFSRVDLVNVGATDYTELSGLDEYSKLDTLFDKDKALEAKAAAVEELTAQGVTFPVKVVVTYNTSGVISNRYQVMEQQLENLLGADYIDIILVPYSGSSFNSDVRNAGDWALLELGWGPDYADPMSQFDPVLKEAIGANWGKLYMATEYYDEALGYGEVEKLALEANSILNDTTARYKKFAEAEKLMLDCALIIPVYRGGGGYTASRLIPFSNVTGQMGDGGARNSVSYGVMADHAINDEEYAAIKAQYLIDRAAAREAYVAESAEYQISAK